MWVVVMGEREDKGIIVALLAFQIDSSLPLIPQRGRPPTARRVSINNPPPATPRVISNIIIHSHSDAAAAHHFCYTLVTAR